MSKLISRPIWDEHANQYVWRTFRENARPNPFPVKKRPPKFSWWKERERLEAICRWLVSFEMRISGSKRFHVVGSLQSGLVWNKSLSGLAGADLGDSLRKAIGRRWRGIDPTILVCDRPPDFRFTTLDEWRQDRIVTATHETCHVIEFFPSWAVRSRCITPAAKLNSVESSTSADASAWKFESFPRWFHHDWRFVWLAFNASYRVYKQFGITTPLWSMMDWNQFGYSCPLAYHDAVVDDVMRLVEVPLSVLKTIAPPQKFLNLWEADTRVHPATIFTTPSQPMLAAHNVG